MTPAKKTIIRDLKRKIHPRGIPNHQRRDEELGKMGIMVLRYTNQNINSNFTSVCADILKKIGIEASQMKK